MTEIETFEGRKLTDRELTLTKAEGSAWSKETMNEFLAFLERWATYQGILGRRVIPDPEPGPGAMKWRAEDFVQYDVR